MPRNVFAKRRKYKRTLLSPTPPGTVVYINSLRSLARSLDSARDRLSVHAAFLSLSRSRSLVLDLSLSLVLLPPPSTWCVRVSIFDGGVSEHLPTKCDQPSRMLKIPVWSTCRVTSMMPSGCGPAKRSSAADAEDDGGGDEEDAVFRSPRKLSKIFFPEFRSCSSLSSGRLRSFAKPVIMRR